MSEASSLLLSSESESDVAHGWVQRKYYWVFTLGIDRDQRRNYLSLSLLWKKTGYNELSYFEQPVTTSNFFLGNQIYLLPTAYEVWLKVLFSQACVIHSVHREGVVCPGGGGSPIFQKSNGRPRSPTREYDQCTVGTHPTGMHSCN